MPLVFLYKFPGKFFSAGFCYCLTPVPAVVGWNAFSDCIPPGKGWVVFVVFTLAKHLFFQGSLFLRSVLCALNTLQWRTRSCPGSQSTTFVSSEMPTKGCYRDSCKHCPASTLLWGGWSHFWFHCSSFEADLVMVQTGWKLRHCDLRGQYAWNLWKVKSSEYVSC